MSDKPVNSVPLFPGRRRGHEPVGVHYYAHPKTDEDAAREAEALQAEARAKVLKANVARASDLCKLCSPRNTCFMCGKQMKKGMHGHMFRHVLDGDDKQWQPSERSKTESTTTT